MGGIGKSYLTYDNVNLHNILLLLLLREVKAQAAFRAIGGCDGASVKLYGVLHDRESEPCTTLLT